MKFLDYELPLPPLPKKLYSKITVKTKGNEYEYSNATCTKNEHGIEVCWEIDGGICTRFFSHWFVETISLTEKV